MRSRLAAALICGLAALPFGPLPALADGPAADDGAMEVESFKRRPPQVAPVVIDGVRYEVTRGPRNKGFAQGSGVISAVSETSGDVLWSIAVYEVVYEGGEETDAQDVFVTGLAAGPNGTLLVTNEKGERFAVSPADQSVTTLGR